MRRYQQLIVLSSLSLAGCEGSSMIGTPPSCGAGGLTTSVFETSAYEIGLPNQVDLTKGSAFPMNKGTAQVGPFSGGVGKVRIAVVDSTRLSKPLIGDASTMIVYRYACGEGVILEVPRSDFRDYAAGLGYKLVDFKR